MNKKTLYTWNPLQLSQLMRIGSEEAVQQGPRNKAAYLEQLLSQNLPMDKTIAEILPAFFKPFCRSMGLIADEPVLAFLLNTGTPIEVLRQIKQAAKEMMGEVILESRRDAAGVVYYAAIAAALIRHGQRITGLPYAQLCYTFFRLKERKWILSELRSLFQNACEICQQKETDKNS
ncbi:MAG: hypothetical protein ABFD91_18695 [Anaerohalosphaeraceae bacterium]